jgi:predicted component of type VI protein secretion system
VVWLAAMIVAIGLVWGGCGAKEGPMTPPPSQPADTVATINWTYAPNSINLGLIAETDLNLTDLLPHSLSLCIYQLSELTWLQVASSTRQGLEDLLACSSNSPGVVSAERRFIQPGGRMDLSFDRLEKTRYLAVVAGFSAMSADRSIKALPIPIKDGRKYLIFKTFEPDNFEAWLLLKAQALHLFFKDSSDFGRSVADLPRMPEEGQPVLTKAEARAERMAGGLKKLAGPDQTTAPAQTTPSSDLGLAEVIEEPVAEVRTLTKGDIIKTLPTPDISGSNQPLTTPSSSSAPTTNNQGRNGQPFSGPL